MSEHTNSRSTRIGLLIASLRDGGAERVALGLLDALDAAGMEVHLLTLDRNVELVPVADENRRAALASRVVRLSGADVRASTLTKVALAPLQLYRLEREIRRLGLDLVLSLVERSNILNLAARSARRKIISIHSFPSLLLRSKAALKRTLVKRSYGRLLRGADRIVFVSREAAADFERIFPIRPDQGVVIYNACDVERVRRLGREEVPQNGREVFQRPVLITCGRLSPEKGHWNLLRAFRTVRDRHPEARLVVLGQGPLDAELLELRRELGLDLDVEFPGFQSNPMPWLARSVAFVLSSHWEGFPNVLLESLALGVPVIAADCRSGPRELLAPTTDPARKTDRIERADAGLLVPAPTGDRPGAGEPLTAAEGHLADAMCTMLEDRDLRESASLAGARRAEEFAPAKVLPQWLQLIRDVA